MNMDEATTELGENAAGQQLAPMPHEALSPEQIEDLKQQAAKASENWDRLLRATADFDNYKKRMTREKQEAVKYANEAILGKLLPVLDNFEMALASAKAAENESIRALQQGIEMVFQQFKQTMKDAGLEEIDAAGAMFDPNIHEAISALESPETPEGQVLQQTRKGYRLRDRLLRPASVVVSKAPAIPTQP
jgi:molecular chaperone GrpE